MLITKDNFNKISLSEFLKDKEIYPSFKAAHCKGYEAEHIKTVSLQMKEYNKEHGTSYTNRRVFEKEVGIPDDRCYRLTPFEHIFVHYLKAKENENEIHPFETMVRCNFQKLTEDEQTILQQLEEFARLREEGTRKNSEALKGKTYKNKGKTMKEITGNPNYVDPKKGKTMQEITGNPNWVSPNLGRKMSKEVREKLSISHKNSEKNKINLAKAQKAAVLVTKGKPRDPEEKAKMTASKNRIYTIIDPNLNIFYIKGLKDFCNKTFEHSLSARVAFGRGKSYKNYYAIRGKVPKEFININNVEETINKLNILSNPCYITLPEGNKIYVNNLDEYIQQTFEDTKRARIVIKANLNYKSYLFEPCIPNFRE